MKQYLLFILLIALISAGYYTSSGNKESSQARQKNSDHKNEETRKNKKVPSLADQFVVPNFQVNSFKPSYNKESNELSIQMTYQVNEKLYKVLSHPDQQYYLSIELPNNISKITGIKNTDQIQGPMLADHRMSSTIVFKNKLPHTLTNKQATYIREKKLDYNLNVFDKDRDLVLRYMDIYLGTTVPQ
ncbi:hypothetical protein [Marininema halotolerans]|uniref:Uncharacterized protein n=1 Tax=Marininema halotolerans TaxID=1155944 RepID=A0A1I6TM93_9BACL|nr:hypothetical protein [Marininema halotolerans]SFS90107.1 hypothetical protein SAMN05444972_110116 [Marininema halotolerans]